MLLILKQANDIKTKVHLFFESGILICRWAFSFCSGKETLTPGKEQRTPTSPAQVDKKNLSSLYFTSFNYYSINNDNHFLSLSHRATEASENLRGSTYIRGPQHSRPEVCHWNPPQPHNQTKSHWSWWVTALLRQSAVGLNTAMLKDFPNPQIRCLYCAFSRA